MAQTSNDGSATGALPSSVPGIWGSHAGLSPRSIKYPGRRHDAPHLPSRPAPKGDGRRGAGGQIAAVGRWQRASATLPWMADTAAITHPAVPDQVRDGEADGLSSDYAIARLPPQSRCTPGRTGPHRPPTLTRAPRAALWGSGWELWRHCAISDEPIGRCRGLAAGPAIRIRIDRLTKAQ